MIQIDMPMPKNCRMCPACSEYDICLIPIDGKGFGEQNVCEFIDSRPGWCPMEEQEAKTWHWIYRKYDDMFMCSSCEKYSIRNDYPYCHWCGAKMKQEGR